MSDIQTYLLANGYHIDHNREAFTKAGKPDIPFAALAGQTVESIKKEWVEKAGDIGNLKQEIAGRVVLFLKSGKEIRRKIVSEELDRPLGVGLTMAEVEAKRGGWPDEPDVTAPHRRNMEILEEMFRKSREVVRSTASIKGDAIIIKATMIDASKMKWSVRASHLGPRKGELLRVSTAVGEEQAAKPIVVNSSFGGSVTFALGSDYDKDFHYAWFHKKAIWFRQGEKQYRCFVTSMEINENGEVRYEIEEQD